VCDCTDLWMHSSSSNLCVRKNKIVNFVRFVCESYNFQHFFCIAQFKDQPFKSVISSLVLNVGRKKT